MRALQYTLINAASVNASTTSAKLDLNQIVKLSGVITVGSGTSLGTIQLQVSNDPTIAGNLPADFTPSNWVNLGSSVAINAAGNTLISQADMCYRWLRAIYTDTFAMVNTVVAVADSSGSLNSKYFTVSTTTVNYYVWFNVNSAGVDPALAGKTGIEVALATNDSAATVGAAIRAATISGIALSGSSATAILTNSVGGPVTVAADGAAPTGFTITNNAPTSVISLNIFALGI